MPSRILERLRARGRARLYVMTLHAEEEMEEDGLTVVDVESALLAGRIVGRQTDRQSNERKYVVRGRSADDTVDVVVVVVKFGPTDLVVILTVYGD